MKNAHVESFNGPFRDECLNEHWFTSLAHAQAVIETWRREYYEERPKKGLGGLTPVAYAKTLMNKTGTVTAHRRTLKPSATQAGWTSPLAKPARACIGFTCRPLRILAATSHGHATSGRPRLQSGPRRSSVARPSSFR